MTTLALSVIFGLILAAVLLDRHQAAVRACEQLTEARAFAATLAAQMGREHVAHRDEVQTLLQRIQAPEVAVIQHAQDDTPTTATYPLDETEQAQAQDFGLAATAILQTIHEHEADVNGTIA